MLAALGPEPGPGRGPGAGTAETAVAGASKVFTDEDLRRCVGLGFPGGEPIPLRPAARRFRPAPCRQGAETGRLQAPFGLAEAYLKRCEERVWAAKEIWFAASQASQVGAATRAREVVMNAARALDGPGRSRPGGHRGEAGRGPARGPALAPRPRRAVCSVLSMRLCHPAGRDSRNPEQLPLDPGDNRARQMESRGPIYEIPRSSRNDCMPYVTPIVSFLAGGSASASPRLCCWLRGRAGPRGRRWRARWVTLPTLSVRGRIGSYKRAE